jgi:hypothetical protein
MTTEITERPCERKLLVGAADPPDFSGASFVSTRATTRVASTILVVFR